MQNAAHITLIDLIVSAAVSSAVISTLLQLVFKSFNDTRLERLKAELDLSNQQIVATQGQLAARNEMQFTWLHQKRAKAMLRIYDLIQEADDAYDAFLRSWGGFVGDRGPDEKWKDAVTAGEAYRQYYRRHKPLFPERVVTELDKLNRDFVEIANKYQIQRSLTENQYIALGETVTKGLPALQSTLDLVEGSFRELFAVED
jgi:hypothetical protein